MSGSLHVITGPMFSGKTEELIRLLRRRQIAGQTVEVFRPETDNRSPELLSRSGYTYPSRYVHSGGATWIATYPADVYGIDEAQFFDWSVTLAVSSLLRLDRHVIVSGLDKTFAGSPFGEMGNLLAMADQVTKLTAICAVCGADATMTQRLVASKDVVVVGGMNDNIYEARCREHHETGELQ